MLISGDRKQMEVNDEQERKQASSACGMEDDMKKYECGPCGYIYDPEVGDPDNGIAPGTPFESLPDDWECPLCSAAKDAFSPAE